MVVNGEIQYIDERGAIAVLDRGPFVTDKTQVVLGERIKTAILDRYPTLRAFADAIQMEPTQLSSILNNPRRRPTPETLDRFSVGLDWSPAVLREWAGYTIEAGDQQGGAGDPLQERAREIIERPRVREQIAAAGGITEEVANAIEDVLVTVLKATTRRDPRT